MSEQLADAGAAGLEERLRQKVSHLNCEDPWYSCPLSSDGCADDQAGNECTCGADHENALRAEALAYIEAHALGSGQQPVAWMYEHPGLPPPGAEVEPFAQISRWLGKGEHWMETPLCIHPATAQPEREAGEIPAVSTEKKWPVRDIWLLWETDTLKGTCNLRSIDEDEELAHRHLSMVRHEAKFFDKTELRFMSEKAYLNHLFGSEMVGVVHAAFSNYMKDKP